MSGFIQKEKNDYEQQTKDIDAGHQSEPYWAGNAKPVGFWLGGGTPTRADNTHFSPPFDFSDAFYLENGVIAGNLIVRPRLTSQAVR
jgi:hypothetical protein